MYFPESEAFVEKHPELTKPTRAVDSYLENRVGAILDVAVMADILGLRPEALQAIVSWYENCNVLHCVEELLCPTDGAVLEMGDDGLAHCDLCDEAYDPKACERRQMCQVRERTGLPVSGTHRFPAGYALLIGIDKYPQAPLKKAAADALALHDLLVDPSYGGYPPAQVHLLLEDDATKSNIDAELEWLAKETGPGSTVIISFSGHGVRRIGGFHPGEYLCPVEIDLSDLPRTGISTSEFTRSLDAIPSTHLAVFLDACHSGGVGKATLRSSSIRLGLSETAYNTLAGSSRVIMASCRSDQYSYELPGMKNGLFTHYLLEGLRGKAADAQDLVRVVSLYAYVAQVVSERCAAQNPYLKCESEDFAIAGAPH